MNTTTRQEIKHNTKDGKSNNETKTAPKLEIKQRRTKDS
jgi:hypothetical protein